MNKEEIKEIAFVVRLGVLLFIISIIIINIFKWLESIGLI